MVVLTSHLPFKKAPASMSPSVASDVTIEAASPRVLLSASYRKFGISLGGKGWMTSSSS